MRYTTAGESHGAGLVAIITDVPAGIELSREAIDGELARRQRGYGRGGRMAIEQDRAQVTAGVRFGRTLGSPVGILIANRDAENWRDAMDPWGSGEGVEPVTAPRPGHADLGGVQRTGATDVRDILERASARETAARVAARASSILCLMYVSSVSVAAPTLTTATPPESFATRF